MLESFRQHRASQLLGTAVSVFRANDWTLNRRDPDGLRYVASVCVWVHWFMVATCLVQLVYRPWYGPERYAAYALLYLVLVGFSAYVHYRLASNRAMTWRWIFALCTLDVLLITAGTVVGGGFSHYCTTRCWPALGRSSPPSGSTWPLLRRWPCSTSSSA